MPTAYSHSELAPIRASYFQRVRNIGDAVTPYLLENVLGRPTVSIRSTEFHYLLSNGSLLQTSTPQSFVWGTGLIHPSAGIGNPEARRILALRGKLTHAELVRSGIGVADMPLGDPGFLIPRLLKPERSTARRFRLGFVPHVFDRDHPLFLAASEDPSVRVLNVCDPVDVFIADLASCDAIASSSLHGLIFGEALGLPSLWIEVSDKVLGAGFKFADWFSLARNPQRTPVRPKTFASANEIINLCEPRQIEIDELALVQAITPEVIEECSRTSRPARTMMHVSVCRANPLPIFIVSYNEADNLRRIVSSCQRQGHAVEVAIYDDGSDEPDTVAYLNQLEQDRVMVYRGGRDHPGELRERVNNAILEFFRDWSEPSRYAVARCGADFSAVDAISLDLYDDLLDRFPRADSVGPALVGLRPGEMSAEMAVNCGTPASAKHGNGGAAITSCKCYIIEGGFDLGFAIYRPGKPLLATMKSLRVCDPP